MSDESNEPPGPFASLSDEGDMPPSRDSKKPRKDRSFWWKILRFVGLACLVIGLISFVGGCVYYNGKALTFDMDELKQPPQRTLVYDREGQVMGHVSGHGENRLVVPTSEVSENFIKALLAREDSRFYDHNGVDLRGVARAVLGNLKAGGMEQGASTITMQLARNTYGMREKNLNRKFMEVALAKRIERKYSKDEILGFYMNRVYFGAGLYGIERASQGFFMKPASDLSLGEGAMLAGVIRGPSLLNPFRSIEDAKDIRNEVLARLVVEETITEAESESARAETIALRPPDKRLATGSYVLQTVFDLLDNFPELTEEEVKAGGLKIYTTIDSKMQASAEKALDDHLTKIENRSGFRHPSRAQHKKGESTKYLQGAVFSVDNANGNILAMAGGRNFGDSSFDRTRFAQRQVGSTFKPFVYAVAFDRTPLLPGAYVSDDAIRIQTGGGPDWTPKNSDGTFRGLQPAAIGLIDSRNTMSVRVGQIAGIGNIRSMARALKFGDIPDSPVIALGAFESSLSTLTIAYSTFPAKGINYAPRLITKIELPTGETKHEVPVLPTRIFPEDVSYITSDIMAQVMDKGTGAGARRLGYKAPAYGKTGTTNDYRDAWFVGFTDKVTTGVWVGLDQPKTIMSRGYGSTLALPIWTEVMKSAETVGFPGAKISPPPNTEPRLICRECSLNASNRTEHYYQMDLPDGLRPSATCRGHGLGIFTSRKNQQPQEFPFGQNPQDPNFQPPPRREEGGGLLRGIGRFLFGGGR